MDLVYCVHITAETDDLPIVSELAASLGFVTAGWRNVETGEAWLRVFTDDEPAAHEVLSQLREALPAWLPLLSASPKMSVDSVRKQDWAECWKEHFHAFRASRRIVVKPSWEEFTPESADDILLELDPGMSFGTGYHGTTRACLEFMDDLAEELGAVSFLEAGCGSGILSLAAVRLGFSPIAAFDHDPQAVMCAKENLELAGVADVDVSTADVGEFAPGRRFAVVAANILAHILDTCAESVASFVEPGGHLLLAGILTEQYPGLKARYEALGFQELRSRTIDEWTSGVYHHSPQS
jgi:ribosomal protein L11 methyltransferase